MRPERDAVAQAEAWRRGRGCGADLEELGRYLLAITAGRPDLLPGLIQELARSCPYASVATALNGMLVRWNRRAGGVPTQ